jgi:hypothetical protein
LQITDRAKSLNSTKDNGQEEPIAVTDICRHSKTPIQPAREARLKFTWIFR